MENDVKPIVSVYITTYNHEKYILKALKSVEMQITTYPIEVLIGEDCSTDNTREILKEYQKTAPSYFTFFYREENMNNLVLDNAGDLINRCKGKYIIALEGDDYWIDKYKLQKQVDFLDQNPEYIAVSHNCIVVDAHSEILPGIYYPECLDSEYTIQHYISNVLPGQLTTVMYRNQIESYHFIKAMIPEDVRKCIPGDRLLYFILLCYGKVHCIQEQMSAYRYVVDGDSWTAKHRIQPHNSKCAQYEALINYSEIKGKQDLRLYIEYDYLRYMKGELIHHRVGLTEFFKLLLRLHNKFPLFVTALKWKTKERDSITRRGSF